MKKRFKWTPTKVIVTILIIAFFVFILFKAGAFNKILNTLTTTIPSKIQPSSVTFSGGGHV